MGLGKFLDLLSHIWIPIVIVGFAGTARNMRVMRGNLLDVLNLPYVLTARSKGAKEREVNSNMRCQSATSAYYVSGHAFSHL